MTRKHYQAIANILLRHVCMVNLHCSSSPNKFQLAYELANYFESENKRFDRLKFYRACGFQVEVDEQKGV